ncbi:P-loop-containing nucleoside triphosphate hydrolase [Chloropicon primus]|uniref:P-loop-containing nucleoside triphosphate hydrolase n=3 Tax=Chloropicon primus TaxID=1764295 RepID=A0A5B8MT79_9CHLO|nr:P-loop-containing nucleoside triphosphate hydrolase [Chloropicon primus]UPR02728.1 P-loop-containing nucleoside triphosphate hydrolase [Chloropicon primus]|eukprot:QDZ23516.1 P-loop-containing nucleoside triphosphate hydrolase [Chloropicon primus]
MVMEDTVGGLGEAVSYLRKLLLWPEEFKEAGERLGVTWPTGLLLFGPPGTGKSVVVGAACREVGAHLCTLSPSSVFGSFVGESEKKVRDIFEAADDLVESGKSVVLFFDEIDVLCPRRDRSGPFECRLVAQILTLMDTSIAKVVYNRKIGKRTGVLLLVGATSNQNAVDPAIRRPGRMEKEIGLAMPDEEERVDILRIYLKKIPMSDEVSGNMAGLAALCSGFTGADIAVLCHEAALVAMEREGEGEGGEVQVRFSDFEAARVTVRPTVTRGVAREADKVSWDDICGLGEVKEQLIRVVQWPIQHPEAFKRLGLQPFRGAMLYGPPGCCKTKLCQAAACTGGIPMISLSCAEVLSMYVGESEEKLRNCFVQARLSAPSIIFLDEFDAFCTKRSGADSGSSVGDKLLATFLTEMDGLEQISGVIVLAATNRPDEIDEALLRPGRFDMLLYVPPPNAEERLLLLNYLTKGMKFKGSGVQLESLAERTEGFTGAELEALCREAYMIASSSCGGEDHQVEVLEEGHFEDALLGMTPMLSEEEIRNYERFRTKR